MKPETSSRPVHGEVLSCYTTAVADYFESRGVDHELVLGTQLFLAVRREPVEDLSLSFLHYHTPLLQAAPMQPFAMERRTSPEKDEAVESILDELRNSGAVIVVGDTARLPWTVTYGSQEHASHFFVVDQYDSQEETVRVRDMFQYLDERGEQMPFTGYLNLDELAECAIAPPPGNQARHRRELLAFGAEEDPQRVAFSGYQWFEAEAPTRARAFGLEEKIDLLQKTVDLHSARRIRSDTGSGEWHCGTNAIEFVASIIEEELTNPLLYEISDDLWVAGRNREMFALTLRRIGRESGQESLQELSRYCESIAQTWLQATRIMHYNRSALIRGRRPRALVVDLLASAKNAEEELIERIEDALPHVGHEEGPNAGNRPHLHRGDGLG